MLRAELGVLLYTKRSNIKLPFFYRPSWLGRWRFFFCTYLAHSLKSRKPPGSFVMSVRPSVCSHVPNRLPLQWFSWNLTLDTHVKVCWEHPDLIKMGQKVGHSIWRPKCVRIVYRDIHSSIILNRMFFHFHGDAFIYVVDGDIRRPTVRSI